MGFWGKIFGKSESRETSLDTMFQLNISQVVATCLALHQYKPPPQMRHVSYKAQADDLLIAALHGDTKAKQVLTEVVADLPGRLFSESLDEATIRLLMQRALNGDQAAQKRVAALLAPLVVPPSQTFAVCEDTNPQDIR